MSVVRHSCQVIQEHRVCNGEKPSDGDENFETSNNTYIAGYGTYEEFENASLMHAVRSNNYDSVQRLINSGVNLNIADRNGRTAVEIAFLEGNFEIARLLLKFNAICNDVAMFSDLYVIKTSNVQKKHAAINIANNREVTTTRHSNALFEAVRSNILQIVKVVLLHFKSEINNLNQKRETPLRIAVENGNISIVKELLKNGANVQENHEDRETAIDVALKNNMEDIFKILIYDKPLHIASLSREKEDIFCNAIIHEKNSIFKLMIQRESDLQPIKDNMKFYSKLLHVAFNNKNYDALTTLIFYGVNFDLKNEAGRTMLNEAALGRQIQVINFLMNFGACLEMTDAHGRTAMHCAAIMGFKDVVEVLLNFGAQVDPRDNYGTTPLQMAVLSKRHNVFDVLIEHGADINNIDHSRHSILYEAVSRGDCTLVEKVLHAGADPNMSLKNHRTPLQKAMSLKALPIVRCLLRHGANPNKRTERFMKHACSSIEESICDCLVDYGFNVRLKGTTILNMFQHIDARTYIRYSVAKLEISPKIEEMRIELKRGSILQYKVICEEEVLKLKSSYVKKDITLFDYLRMNRRCLVQFMQDDSFKSAIINQIKFWMQTFPIYNDILYSQFIKGLQYEEVMDPARENLSKLSGYRLDVYSLDIILNHLNVEDMRNLTNVFNTNQVPTEYRTNF